MCQNKRQVLLLREPAGNIFVISQLLDPYLMNIFFCFSTQLAWVKAIEFCKSYHMNLISIESTKEQEDVTNILMPIVLNGNKSFL